MTKKWNLSDWPCLIMVVSCSKLLPVVQAGCMWLCPLQWLHPSFPWRLWTISVRNSAPNETTANIVANLQQVVIEHEPFAELLLDNSTAFRSAAVEQVAMEWDISLRFCAAYAPSGNAIIECERRHFSWVGDILVNVMPRKDVDETSVPSVFLFRSPWRVHNKTTWQPPIAREVLRCGWRYCCGLMY